MPRYRVLLRPDSIAITLITIRSTPGISILPLLLSDRDSDLVAAPLELPISSFELWVVSHERLRKMLSGLTLMVISPDICGLR